MHAHGSCSLCVTYVFQRGLAWRVYPRTRDRPQRRQSPSAMSAGNWASVARRVRESQDLTLTDVATSAGISAGMLRPAGNGSRSPPAWNPGALARALGVRPVRCCCNSWAGMRRGAALARGPGARGGQARHPPVAIPYHLLAAQRGPRKSFEPVSRDADRQERSVSRFSAPRYRIHLHPSSPAP